MVGVQSYSLGGEASFDVGVGGMLPAIKHPRLEVRAGDSACRLCPGDHNVHEIHSVGASSCSSFTYGTDVILCRISDAHKIC